MRVVIPVAVVMVVALAVAYLADVPVSDLLRDPSAVLDGPWYVGLFSTTGIALWAVAVAVSLLPLAANPDGPVRRLLVAGAVGSLLLGADDAYLLHETIKNEVGIPSPVTIGLIGLVTLAMFVPVWRHLVGRHDFWVFVLALLFLAGSAILDAAGEAGLPTPPASAIIEDAAKFLGILTWAAFFAGVGAGVIRQAAVRSDVTV